MYVPNPIPRHFYSQKERQERFCSHRSLHKERKDLYALLKRAKMWFTLYCKKTSYLHKKPKGKFPTHFWSTQICCFEPLSSPQHKWYVYWNLILTSVYKVFWTFILTSVYKEFWTLIFTPASQQLRQNLLSPNSLIFLNASLNGAHKPNPQKKKSQPEVSFLGEDVNVR